MAKTVIRISDEEFNFLLIGIVSQHRDFRVSREVNRALEISLKRGEDYLLFSQKRNEEVPFSFFEYKSAEEDQYFIISNKCEKGLLIPEQKQMDYFLLIKPGMSEFDATMIVQRLKPVKIFLGLFPMDVLKLKSKENLLF